MTLLERVAVVGLAIVYWPVLVMLVVVLPGSGRLIASQEVLGLLIIATVLAYGTVRGVPQLRRTKR